MPTRTPAEKERIKKREARNRLLIRLAAVAVIAAFVIIGECSGLFKKLAGNSDASAEPSPSAEVDKRLDYLGALGVADYTVGDVAVTAVIHDDDSKEYQLVAANKEGPVELAVITSFSRYSMNGSSGDLFHEIDFINESKEVSLKKLEPVVNELSELLKPLIDERQMNEIGSEIAAVLYDIYIGTAESRSIIAGAYTVVVSYSAEDELLRMSAAPAD